MGEKKLREFEFKDVQVKATESSIALGLKRTVDVVISIIGLILTFPLMVIFGILIKLESPGPAIFTQERVGYNGIVFNLYKIRSMTFNPECELEGKAWTEKEDSRITRFGKIIRKFRVDEFPQFLNVLKGDMSIIGPRPETPYLTEQIDKEVPGFKKRVLMKPGLSGWAQVNGGYEHTPEEKLFYDLEYINNYRLMLDLKIAFKTVYVIFTGHGSR